MSSLCAEPIQKKARIEIPKLPSDQEPSCSLKAIPTKVTVNHCTTLTMKVRFPESVASAVLNSQPLAMNPGQDMYTRNVCVGSVAKNYTYSASLKGTNGSVNDCSTTVMAKAPPPPPPSCTLKASVDPVRYDCGRPEDHATILRLFPKGEINWARIDGTPAPPYQKVISWDPDWKHGKMFVGSVGNSSGSGTCTQRVGVRCAKGGVIVENVPGWGFRQGANNPPTCDYDYHCKTESCAEEVGGWVGKRGCKIPGCFAPETRLLTGNGSLKRADRITKGDTLWNPVREKAFEIETMVLGPEQHPLVLIGYGEKSVTVTSQHPMITKDGLKSAGALRSSDYILGADQQFYNVTQLKLLPQRIGETVYHFKVNTSSKEIEDHLIVAEGILTGDHYLQEMLETSRNTYENPHH